MVNVSIYSCIMGLLWFNIGVTILFILRRNNNFIRNNGAKILFVLALGCIFRIIFPLDLSFAKVIRSKKIYPWILDTFNEPIILSRFSLLSLLLIAFIAIGIFLFVYEILKYVRFRKSVEQLESKPSANVMIIYKNILNEFNVKRVPKLVQNSNVSTPYMTGFLNPMIALPDKCFSDKELHYIFRHEIIHYINNDVWIKWLNELLFSFLWWNPFTYFFKNDLVQILEIKCDTKACEYLDDTLKIEYTKTIISIIRLSHSGHENIKPHYYSSAMAKERNVDKHIIQRFEVILHPTTLKRHKVFSYFTFAIMFIMLLLSYAFIIQPAYIPTEGDFPFSIMDLSLSIVFEDGVYKLYDNNNFLKIIDESSLSDYLLQEIPLLR